MLARPSKLEIYRDPRTAREYDRRWRGSRGARRNRRKAVALQKALDCFHVEPDQTTVLDVPCGTGRFSEFISNLGFRYSGVDLSVPMLLEARDKFTAQYFAADIQTLPLDDNAIDICVSIRFLHLVRDPQLRILFLLEMARVSKLGVIVDYRHNRTLRYWSRRIRHLSGHRSHAPSNPSIAQIHAEIQSAGLRPFAAFPVRFAPGFSDKVLLAASSQCLKLTRHD